MSKKKDKSGRSDSPPVTPFNNPFGALAAVVPTAKPPNEEPKVDAVPAPLKGPARAVVRMERKGHGGKEVTVVEQLGLPPRELEVWLKALKGKLGCGGTLGEEGALVLQGDQRERLPAILQARGVRKVIVG